MTALLTRRTIGAALALGLAGTGGAATVATQAHATKANPFATYDAIVALNNCSGSVVRFPGASDSDKAIVMTNGHCGPTMPDADTYVYDKASSRKATILGGEDAHTVTSITLDRILYATMTGTDITVYRSTSSYSDLASAGVTPRPMSTTHPASNIAIDIPSGYWKTTYSCTVVGFVPTLLEDQWTWKDAIKYSTGGTCNPQHGSSGSPIIDRATGTQIGINNTGNDDGEMCTENNPCEVDASGRKTATKGQSYGEQTYQIYSCFANGRIDLAKAGCQLFGAKNPNPAPTPTPTPTPTSSPTATPTSSPTASPTSSPTAPSGTNVVVNPGFEDGTKGWTGSRGPINSNTLRPAHSGRWKLWLGGNGARGSEYEQQTIAIPAGSKATLTYWVAVDTDEAADGTKYDTFSVSLGGKTVDTLSNVDTTNGFVQRTVDVSAYAGKSVALKFAAVEDEHAQSSFVVDDVSVTVG